MSAASMRELDAALAPSALGVPDLDAFGPQIGVRFRPRRMARSRVLWLNRRWFFERGCDVASPDIRAALEEWLLSNYAAIVQGDWDPESAYADGESELCADRYGAPGGAPNGGSGRCGFSGAFNAKGIGRTPLVSADADWYHSHGCLWVEEAMREAIAAEVADAELPHGAVPVVAIIDPGMRIHGPPTGIGGVRRAILIRPNFIRLAHFERSIRFGKGGHSRSEQYQDALRTEDAVRALRAHLAGEHDLRVPVRSVREIFARIAEQAGSGWSQRLFHGGLFSSNIGVDGQWLDFGNFRSLPDWRRHVCGGRGAAFGAEIGNFRVVLHSLNFYFRRYGQSALAFDTDAMCDDMGRVAIDAFVRDGLHGLGLSRHAGAAFIQDAERLLVGAFFAMQSRSVRDLRQAPAVWRRAWSGLDAGPGDADPTTPGFAEIASLGRVLRQSLSAADYAHVREQSLPWLRGRSLLNRDLLVRTLSGFAESAEFDAPSFPETVAARIDAAVAKARRRWRMRSPEASVLAAAGDVSTSLLRVRPAPGARPQVHLIASACGDRALVFGRSVEIARLPARDAVVVGGRLHAVLDVTPENWLNDARMPMPVGGAPAIVRFKRHE